MSFFKVTDDLLTYASHPDMYLPSTRLSAFGKEEPVYIEKSPLAVIKKGEIRQIVVRREPRYILDDGGKLVPRGSVRWIDFELTARGAKDLSSENRVLGKGDEVEVRISGRRLQFAKIVEPLAGLPPSMLVDDGLSEAELEEMLGRLGANVRWQR